MALVTGALGVLTHPLALNIVLLATIAAVNGFTPPNSPIRLYIGLPIVSLLTWHLMTTSFIRTGSSAAAGMYGAPPVGFLLQYIDTALIGKWDVRICGPHRIIGKPKPSSPGSKQKEHDAKGTRQSDLEQTCLSRLRFGVSSILDIRGTNTPWESKYIPHFSDADPSWVPSKAHLVVESLLRIAGCYALTIFLGFTPAVLPLDENAQRYTHDKVNLIGRLSEVTVQELQIRLITTVKKFTLTMCGLEIIYRSIAVTVVLLGISKTQDMRPLFNSPLKAYTIRNFWGPFFHQIWRRRFTSIAYVITFDFLKFRKGGIPARYLTTFLVFLLSGLLHYSEYIARGMPWRETGAIAFFAAQAGGIIVEDIVGSLIGMRHHKPSTLLQCLGYVWVLSFLTLTGPHWVYPGIERFGE